MNNSSKKGFQMQYDYIVIDSFNMAYRLWWHVKDFSHNDTPTGLEYGFIKGVLSYLKSNPESVYLAWDGKPVRCNNLIENYKEGRVKVNSDEPDWGPRLDRLKEVFSHLCYTLYHPEEEADEQIAKFVLAHPNKRILIISNDKDLQQLVTSTKHVEVSGKLMDISSCNEKWGIPPYKISLYKALDGDKSDSIPGVPRLRSKTKVMLVNLSETIEDLVSHFEHEDLTAKEKEKLLVHKDQVLLNYQAVNLQNLEGNYDLFSPDGDKSLLKEMVSELGFASIKIED